MKLQVLGSSSAGNCYLLSNKDEALVIEAGIPFDKVLVAVDFKINNIKGVLASHIHGDHSKRIKEYLKLSMDVYAPFKADHNYVLAHTMEDMKEVKIGKFTVLPFAVKHDVDTLAFVISHVEFGNLLFATDTRYLPIKLDGLNHVMIEANYDLKVLQQNVMDGKIDPFLARRIIKGHFSIENAIDTMNKNDLSQVSEIILLHLSGANSDPDDFKTRMEAATGVPTFIAKKGFETNLLYI